MPEAARRNQKLHAVVAVVLAAALFFVFYRPAQMPGRSPLLIDTDAGTDDLIAIAYMMEREDFQIDAVTTVTGVTRADVGARNVLRLARAGGRRLEVLAGESEPLESGAVFPEAWQRQAEELPGVRLPDVRRRPRGGGVAALLKRLHASETPVRILTLGPLTNIAVALRADPRAAEKIGQLTVMGGAIDVPGNAPENATSPVAEWNMYLDPLAASIVFRSGIPVVLVPLDATNRVPIDRAFLRRFTRSRPTVLGGVVEELLESAGPMIDAHSYYAWDPLAAVAATDEGVIETRELAVDVVRLGEERGRIRLRDNEEPNALVAYSASPQMFARLFFDALTRGR